MHGTEATKYSLTLLNIENDLLRNIDMSSLINDFALHKRISMTYARHLQNETSIMYSRILAIIHVV
jgi:hypothetical protein